uniref:Uncharacterized protein n=1 Tax=Glossina brevipalpis TaxID=37001 RepID=A0A1A9W4A0_9MUSC
MSLIAGNNYGDSDTSSIGNGLLKNNAYDKYEKLIETTTTTRTKTLTANATRQQINENSKNRWHISNPPSPPYHRLHTTPKNFDGTSDRYFLSNALSANANANILPSTSVATILPTFVSVSTRLLPATQSATNITVPMQTQTLLSQSKSTSSELLLPPDDDSYSVSVSSSHLNTVSSSSSSYYQHPLSSSSNSSTYLTTPSSASPPSSSSSSSSSSSTTTSLFCYCCNNFIARCCFGSPFVKAVNVRRCVLALFAITVMTIFYYTHYVDTGNLTFSRISPYHTKSKNLIPLSGACKRSTINNASNSQDCHIYKYKI